MRYLQTSDPSSIMADEAVAEATELLGLIRFPDAASASMTVIGMLHWERYGRLRDERGQTDLHRALTAYAHLYRAEPDAVPDQLRAYVAHYGPDGIPPLHPEAGPARTWQFEADDLVREHDRTGAVGPLEEAIARYRRALHATPPGHHQRPDLTSLLGTALQLHARQTRDAAELGEAIAVLRSAVEQMWPGYERPALNWARLAAALEQRAEPGDLEAALALLRQANAEPGKHRIELANRLAGALLALDRPDATAEAVALLRECVAAFAEDDPERVPYTRNLALALGSNVDDDDGEPPDPESSADTLLGWWREEREEYQHTGDPWLLPEVVDLGRRALAALPAGDDRHGLVLNNLASDLRLAYRHDPDPGLLTESIELNRRAVTAMPADDPAALVSRWNLAEGLEVLAERTGDAAALAEAVETMRQTVRAAGADDARRPRLESALGRMLREVYDHTGDPAPLAEAEEAGRRAIAGPGGPDHGHLSELGLTVWARARYDGDAATARAADELLARALDLAGDDHLARGRYHDLRCIALQEIYRLSGDGAALDEAIDEGGRAVALIGNDPGARRLNLSLALLMRAERANRPADVQEAVRLARQALDAAAADDPDRGRRLDHLGIALRTTAELTGDAAALREAVECGRAAVSAGGPPAELAGRWNNLALALGRSAETVGDEQAPAEAAAAARRAVELGTRATARATFRATLARMLLVQYRHTSDSALLAEAHRAAADAAGATPPGHHDRGLRFETLGNVLHATLERTGDPAVLAELVAARRESLAASPPGHPDRSGRLSNLALDLGLLHDHAPDPALPGEQVRLLREAAGHTPAGHPSRRAVRSNLGVVLLEVYETSRDESALLDAVTAGRESVAGIEPGDPSRAGFEVNLAQSLAALHTATLDPAPLAEAAERLERASAAANAPTRVRVLADRALGGIAMLTGDPAAALRAYERAVERMPMLAPRRLLRADREHGLGQLAGLGAEAASVAVAAGAPERAVELLEQARGLLLAETIDLRGDVDALREHDPAVVERFVALREELDAASGLAPADRDALLAEWDALLTRVRAVPALAGFLRPPPIATLTAHAGRGAVAIVNVSRYSGEALLLVPGSPAVLVVPLPGLTPAAATAQLGALAHGIAGTADPDAARRREGREALDGTLEWLWQHVAEPVLDRLEPAGAEPPRLWWCPVGPLALLPLHAAGRAGGPAVMDRVVSSYTPTLRALGYARRAEPAPPGPGDTVVVAMTTTAGAAPLPGADIEARRIRALLPQSSLLRDAEATHDAVVAALRTHRIAHLACHGSTDPREPSRSRLLVHDDAEHPLTVAAIAGLRLTGGALAYLSACSTAATTPRLADESVHLTAAFQLAGYRQVIGTLWEVDDRAAARLADELYTDLTGDGSGPPDTARTARALHRVVRSLRAAYPQRSDLWAAHIHVGA